MKPTLLLLVLPLAMITVIAVLVLPLLQTLAYLALIGAALAAAVLLLRRF